MEYSRKVTPLRHYPIPKYTLRILPKTDLFLFQPQNKILTQNPLEYRAVAETAVAVGARPQDLGFEAEQGGDFCLRLMVLILLRSSRGVCTRSCIFLTTA